MTLRDSSGSPEELLKLWREAAHALREAGGLLYPGSEPVGGTMGAEYRQACHVLGIPPDAWVKWLDALDLYNRAVNTEDPGPLRKALGLSEEQQQAMLPNPDDPA